MKSAPCGAAADEAAAISLDEMPARRQHGDDDLRPGRRGLARRHRLDPRKPSRIEGHRALRS